MQSDARQDLICRLRETITVLGESNEIAELEAIYDLIDALYDYLKISPVSLDDELEDRKAEDETIDMAINRFSALVKKALAEAQAAVDSSPGQLDVAQEYDATNSQLQIGTNPDICYIEDNLFALIAIYIYIIP